MSAVTPLISSAQSYANTIGAQAQAAISAATDAARLVFVLPDYKEAALPDKPPVAIDTTLPNLIDLTLDLPSEPNGALTLQDISPIETGEAPTLDAEIPTLTMPDKPSHLAEFMGMTPTIETKFDFPTPPPALDAAIADLTLTERESPEKPQITLPNFDAQKPDSMDEAPNDFESRLDQAYQTNSQDIKKFANDFTTQMLQRYDPGYESAMRTIQMRLDTYLEGGTALAPEVEAAIFARAQERNDLEAKRLSDAIYNESAARGFTIPSGAINSQIQRARQDASNNNNKTSNEIIVAHAELEQKNLQFAITTSTNLRATLLNASLAYMQNIVTINGQALDYAKTVLSAVIEVYNTSLKAYSAKLEAYKVEASVFDMKLRAAMAGLELYKAEIQALEALTQVDLAKVGVYKARVDSLQSLAAVYKARVEAVVSKANLEKLKLDLFQSQVQAYGAQVQSKTAEWQGYSAAVGGQIAATKVYSAQVEAFNAKVNGFKATIEAKSEAVRATATTNKARADNYSAQISGYSAVVKARGDVANTKLQMNSQLIQAFQAKVQAAIGDAQVQSEYYKATSNVAIQNAQGTLKAGLSVLELARSQSQTIAQLGTANASVFGKMAGAAMAGMNTLVYDGVVK